MSDSLPSTTESDSSYVVVARRYRPRNFDELVGQEHVGRALKNAIETSRVGHAYLFTGARGVGKTSTARIFAKALNNPDGPSAVFDDASDIAQAIDSGEDIDVIEIDGASNRGIDEIRSLRANVGVRPSRSRFKIYIIDEVHMLTQAAFNALLKTLEEPPEHVKFIFCTTDPEKIPITVLSRCQRFDFAPVEVAKIVERLREIVTAENASADDAALELIGRRAAGSMRDSQSLLEQVLSFSDGNLTADKVHAMLGTADDERLYALARAMCDRDAASAIAQLDDAIDAGVDAGRIAEQLLGFFRDLMAVTVGCDPSLQRHTAASTHDDLKQLGDQWGLQTVLAVVALIDQTLTRMRLSVYGRVLLESTVIQICNLPDLQAIADLAAAASSGSQPSTATRTSSQAVTQKKKLTTETQASAKTSVPPQAADPQPTPSFDAPSLSATPQASPQEETAQPVEGSEPEASTDDRQKEEQPTPLAEPVSARQLSESNVCSVFTEALSSVQQITASIAASAEVKLNDPNEIRLVFPAESMMSMKRMELPEHRDSVSRALETIVGRPIRLAMSLGPPSKKPAAEPKSAPKVTARERHEVMREVEKNPWVQICVETFQAEIIKVDPSS